MTRRRAAHDERSVEVGLTDAGAALRDRVESVPRRIAAATGLTGPELVALRDTLTRISETIHEQHDPGHHRQKEN